MADATSSSAIFDIAVVGAGAAGLMAAIHAGRAARTSADEPLRIIVLDGARSLGAKILVAGGGRCNVTHHAVDERAYAGSSPKAIRKVLRRFDVPETIAFFRELGVELKREESGKLFPTTDKARTVLDALLGAARGAGVDIRYPWRVERILAPEPKISSSWVFTITGPSGELRARRVVLATGGRSLPKSGSDGHGHEIVRSLGHTITPYVFPALVPLTMPRDHPLCALSGIALPVALELRSATGKRLTAFTNAMLLTHFGISGPGPLDISRYLIDARHDDPAANLIVNWLPGETIESIDTWLLEPARVGAARRLAERPAGGMPERLARTLCEMAGVDPARPTHALPREMRRRLARMLVELPLPITGDRGFTHAEVTAGGVPLRELHLETMESRLCPGLYLCGEICDVDGRIGGFNFQWAWSSGYVAGSAAASSPLSPAADYDSPVSPPLSPRST